jgi:hypothetical protein
MVFASFLILWPGTPMNLLYAVSAQGNPLYQGKFGLHGRYQTYGQHSFIYDLIAATYRRGVRVTLLVEGLSGFPLAEPLKKYAHVFELDEAPQLGTVDLVLVDQPTDKLVDCPSANGVSWKGRNKKTEASNISDQRQPRP